MQAPAKIRAHRLGLAISRELAQLLVAKSISQHPGKGSSFTLYLPLKYSGPTVANARSGAVAVQYDTACRSRRKSASSSNCRTTG